MSVLKIFRSLFFVVVLSAPFSGALAASALPSPSSVDTPPTLPLLTQPQDQVSVKFDANGLSSLSWHGIEFFYKNTLWLNWVKMLQPDGSLADADLSSTTSVDAANRTVTQKFSWGLLRCAFSTNANFAFIDVTITNSSSTTLDQFCLTLAELKFPAQPAEFSSGNPMLASNIGAPTIITESFGSGVMALTNEDVSQPLMVGFPWKLDSAGTVFPLNVNTGQNYMYPTSLPDIERQIPAGGSLQFRLALRFGPAGTNAYALASDIYEKFAQTFLFQNRWQDHRSIAGLFLASSADGWPKNPRGFFNDPSVDVTTPSGLADFKNRLMNYADTSIAIMRDMNAQGMITWDAEGEQFPHAISYIGDPRLVEKLAPEMSGVIDDYFKKFRDAGFRVGMTLRPQQLVLSADGASATQNEVANPAALLVDKIAYAKNRWSATLFYIDSNGDQNSPVDAQVISRVMAANPDVLLIPEHKTTAYYGMSAPFSALTQGVACTPPDTRLIYPKAFSAIFVPDGDIAGNWTQLVDGVRQGDILLFRGWFNSNENQQVKSIYQQAAAQ